MALEKLSAIAVFTRVVDENGFSSAARSLGLSTSYVSRQVSSLEARLGVRLLNRSTRRLSLTPVGALFYRNCSSILAQVEEAELAVTQLQTVPRGLLRVSAPDAFGQRYLVDAIADFMALHDDLEVHFTLDSRAVDPVEEGYDVVVQLGGTRSNRVLSRPIVQTRRLLVASPAYLVRAGHPRGPDDLADHRCLHASPEPEAGAWEIEDGVNIPQTVNIQPLLSTNHDEVVYAAALRGRGIAFLPDYLVWDDLQEGRLTRVMEPWQGLEQAVCAAYPEQKHLSAKVRLLVHFLMDHLRPLMPPGTVPLVEAEPEDEMFAPEGLEIEDEDG